MLADADGSLIRHVAPAKTQGPYLVTSQPDWWNLDPSASWQEPRFGNAWINPMPDAEVAARIEMRVQNSNGDRYTLGAFDGHYGDSDQGQRIGYVSQFGDVNKYVPMTRIEGTLGMTGETDLARMPSEIQPLDYQSAVHHSHTRILLASIAVWHTVGSVGLLSCSTTNLTCMHCQTGPFCGRHSPRSTPLRVFLPQGSMVGIQYGT